MTPSRSALGLLCFSTVTLGCLGPELTFAPDDGSGGSGNTNSTTGTTTQTTTTSAGGAGSTGSTTGPGGAGGTGGGGCSIPPDCPDPGSLCIVPTCEGGQCGTQNVSDGVALPPPAQVPGDCLVAACDGEGNVVGLDDDADVPEDFNDCTVDACSSGEPSNDPEPLNTPCGAGGTLFCNGVGQCVGCVDPGECAGADDDCKARSCEAGVCGVDFTADGVPVSVQAPGDCQLAVCDGSGNETGEIDDLDVDDDLEACTIESCSGGVPNSTNVETGIPCGDGPSCDDSGPQPMSKTKDVCSGFGACLAQSAETCPAAPQCLVPTCEGASCGDDPGPIDVPCDFAANLDGFCDGFGTCVECTDDVQCGFNEACDLGSGTCQSTCGNGTFDGDETDTDCGGSCPADCVDGEGCLIGADCQSAFCGADLTCASSRLVFLTAAPVFANMGGVPGADTMCQTLASNAGLPGTFRAWISDVGSSPSTRFTQSSVPYRQRNGTAVANNWAQLTSGALLSGITIDQTGASLPGAEVWTGTDILGNWTGDSCSDWSTLAGTGGVGLSGATDFAWTSVYSQFCNRDNVRLYCFQQ